MEIALDFAINCSPDHPYVREHPDWFYQRPDGSIKFAENPPKKYEDIYPAEFSLRKLAGALGGNGEHRSLLGGSRGAHLSRR